MDILKEDHLSCLPQDLISKAKSMSKAYEYIYCIENIIRLYLIDKLGNNFKQSEKVKNGIEKRKEDETKHKWLPLRGDSDLFYMDFRDLIGIINMHWESLKNDFPDSTWITAKLEDLARFRNIIAHNGYLDNTNFETVRVYFNTIIRQLGIQRSQKNNKLSIDSSNSFINGLKNNRVYTYNELYSGINHPLNYPPELNVAPCALTTEGGQLGPSFYATFEKSGVYLYPEFQTGDIQDFENLYEHSNILRFEIGQYDIDSDGIDEIFICLQVNDPIYKIDNSLIVNIFKYYPPAFHKHTSRPENWELWGPFSTGMIMGVPKAEIKNNSISISRNFRSYYDEWTFVKDEFIHRGI